MTDKPTQKEMNDLFVEETGFDPDDFPAAIFGFTRAALAKWGQPAQAAEPLTYEQILALWAGEDQRGLRPVLGSKKVLAFARAIEAEVRKQDDALIRQLVDALDDSIDDSRTVLAEDQLKYMARYKPERLAEQQRIVTDADAALTAARKRLEGKP